jgi:hypothetical protein
LAVLFGSELTAQGIRTSALPPATTANTTDELPANQAGTSRKVTVQQIVDHAGRVANIRTCGATGDGVTDDTAAIANCIATAESTNIPLYIPCGNPSGPDTYYGYKVTGTGSTIFTLAEPLLVYGEGPCSWIMPATGVPTTRDVFVYDPANAGIAAAFPRFYNFRLSGETAGVARYGINFKPSATETLSRVSVERIWVANLSNFAVYIDGSASGTSGATTSWIRDCNFNGPGVGGTGVRDSILIDNSVLFGVGYAIDVTFVSGGPGKFIVQNSNITASGGLRFGGHIYSLTLVGNYFEPLSTYTGANNAYVDLDGASGEVIHSPVVAGNLFAIISGVGDPDALRLNYVNDAAIADNMFRIDPAAADAIAITANANRTVILPSNGINPRVVNAGTGTVNWAGSTGVPRVSTGTWTFDAGLSHLASSTSAQLATLISDETGTGANVHAVAATMTNTTLAGAPILGDGAGNDNLSFAEEATNPACAAGDYRLWANSVDGRLKQCANGAVADVGGGSLSTETLSIADDGAGTQPTATLTPTKPYVKCACTDANGCTVTMGETGMADGRELVVISTGTNACIFADTAGVSELPGGVTLGTYDSLRLLYVTDRWVAVSTSNN